MLPKDSIYLSFIRSDDLDGSAFVPIVRDLFKCMREGTVPQIVE